MTDPHVTTTSALDSAANPRAEETTGAKKIKNRQHLIDDTLMAGTILFTNVRDPQILEAFARFRMTEDKINSGESLHKTLDSLQKEQKKEYSEQYTAVNEFHTLSESAYSRYMDIVKLARAALRLMPEKLMLLGLVGDRNESFAGFSGQAALFYDNAFKDSSVAAALDAIGITQELLEEEKALLKQAVAAKAGAEKEKSEAVEATRKRDEALDTYNFWYSGFKTVAKVALKNRPDLLKKLGF